MKLESRLPKQTFWLYMGPALNVLTLLMIFFLLGSTFVIQSGVHVNLPESGSRLSGFDRAHVITVPAGGGTLFYLDGRPQTPESLKAELEKAKAGTGRKVIVHVDAMAPGGRIFQAGNIALGLGYDVAYATQPPRADD